MKVTDENSWIRIRTAWIRNTASKPDLLPAMNSLSCAVLYHAVIPHCSGSTWRTRRPLRFATSTRVWRTSASPPPAPAATWAPSLARLHRPASFIRWHCPFLLTASCAPSCFSQCSGSVTFWYGSGSLGPFKMDCRSGSGSGSALFGSDFQDCN